MPESFKVIVPCSAVLTYLSSILGQTKTIQMDTNGKCSTSMLVCRRVPEPIYYVKIHIQNTSNNNHTSPILASQSLVKIIPNGLWHGVFDVVYCSDIINHVSEEANCCQPVKRCNAKFILISTPE